MRVSVLVCVSFLCLFAAQLLLMSVHEAQMLRSSPSVERSCTQAQTPASRLHSNPINMENIEKCKQATRIEHMTSACNAVLSKYSRTHTHTHTFIRSRHISSDEGLSGCHAEAMPFAASQHYCNVACTPASAFVGCQLSQFGCKQQGTHTTSSSRVQHMSND